MVIVMHKAQNTVPAFNYNEKKVEQKRAQFFHSRNTNAANAFIYTKDYRLELLQNIEAKNKRVKNKCFHVSVNPTQNDLAKLSDNDLRKEMDAFMKRIGQPPTGKHQHQSMGYMERLSRQFLYELMNNWKKGNSYPRAQRKQKRKKSFGRRNRNRY